MSEDGIDWRLVLKKVMWCFVQEEGTLYSHCWHTYGLTKAEIEAAEKAFNEYQEERSSEE